MKNTLLSLLASDLTYYIISKYQVTSSASWLESMKPQGEPRDPVKLSDAVAHKGRDNSIWST